MVVKKVCAMVGMQVCEKVSKMVALKVGLKDLRMADEMAELSAFLKVDHLVVQ